MDEHKKEFFTKKSKILHPFGFFLQRYFALSMLLGTAGDRGGQHWNAWKQEYIAFCVPQDAKKAFGSEILLWKSMIASLRWLQKIGLFSSFLHPKALFLERYYSGEYDRAVDAVIKKMKFFPKALHHSDLFGKILIWKPQQTKETAMRKT